VTEPFPRIWNAALQCRCPWAMINCESSFCLLEMIARTSSMACKQTSESLTQIARELGVDDETEFAMQWLEQAFEERDVHMTFLLDYKWDGIRSHERFQKLLSRVGFPVSAAPLAGA
jgi:hypothetical protein